jgi:hypothetical protein
VRKAIDDALETALGIGLLINYRTDAFGPRDRSPSEG